MRLNAKNTFTGLK